MASAGARVTIRETTTTTNMQASVLVINTGYLKTKEGFTKLLLLILCAICFTLVLIESHGYSNYHGKSYGYYAGDLFLLLVAFAHLYLTCVMLIACLLYLSTASLLPKISIVSIDRGTNMKERKEPPHFVNLLPSGLPFPLHAKKEGNDGEIGYFCCTILVRFCYSLWMSECWCSQREIRKSGERDEKRRRNTRVSTNVLKEKEKSTISPITCSHHYMQDV